MKNDQNQQTWLKVITVAISTEFPFSFEIFSDHLADTKTAICFT